VLVLNKGNPQAVREGLRDHVRSPGRELRVVCLHLHDKCACLWGQFAYIVARDGANRHSLLPASGSQQMG
jgi:hypothetical protein